MRPFGTGRCRRCALDFLVALNERPAWIKRLSLVYSTADSAAGANALSASELAAKCVAGGKLHEMLLNIVELAGEGEDEGLGVAATRWVKAIEETRGNG